MQQSLPLQSRVFLISQSQSFRLGRRHLFSGKFPRRCSPLSDRDEVVDAVVAREKSLSTGLEHGLAIPHGVVGCIADTLSALGVCKEGVPFDAIDGQRVKLVILILIPEGTFQRHVRTLASIARLGSTPELRNRIFEAQTPADVMSVLRQADYEDY